MTYTYNFKDDKYQKYVCILSVLAQCAIDNAKRKFDVDLNMEIREIKKNMNIGENKYPQFWNFIRKGFNKKAENVAKEIKDLELKDIVPKRYQEDTRFMCEDKDSQLEKLKLEYELKNKINLNLDCPMNCSCKMKIAKFRLKEDTIEMKDIFVKHKIENKDRRKCKKVEELIGKYSIDLFKFNTKKSADNDNMEEFILVRDDFDELIEDIRKINISGNYVSLISWLIDRAFSITSNTKNNSRSMDIKTKKNKSLLLKTLYDVNKKTFLECFEKKVYTEAI